MLKAKRNRPVIGLALGSGSARGWSHIGVIRELKAMGIRPDLVTGASIGAFVGAGYALDKLDVMENWVRTLRWKDIVGLMDVSFLGGGFLKGDKLMCMAGNEVRKTRIEQLEIPLGVVTTELDSGQEVWLQEGSLTEAVRASMAFPGLFTPVAINGRWHVDGGLVNPVPVSLCRAMGAEIVIAVNLNGDLVGRGRRKPDRAHDRELLRLESEAEMELYERMINRLKSGVQSKKKALLKEVLGTDRPIPGMFEVMASSVNIMQDRITRSRMAGDPADVILSPRLGNVGMLEFDSAAEVIAEGQACVARNKEVLREVIGRG